MNSPAPRAARFVDDRYFEIAWDDGLILHYSPFELRRACPCAHCVEARTKGPDRLPDAEVRLRKLNEVGRYAFQLEFSDGHNLGIYPYDQLRALGHPPGEAPRPPEPAGFDV